MIEMFAVFDAAAERYIEPFPASTVQVAIRGFEEACQQEGHQFRKFPMDYTLFHVGTFDPELGEMTGWTTPRKVAMASSYIHGSQRDLDLLTDEDVAGLYDGKEVQRNA